MKIIISDSFGGIKHVGNYPEMPIPRIGENVVWYYAPTPTVSKIFYNYEQNEVIISLKESEK